METSIEKIERNGKILAIITRTKALEELEQSGKNMLFVSPDEFPFQVGIHSRKDGDKVLPHAHIPFQELKNLSVQEFFYIISGKVIVDLFDENDNNLKVKTLTLEKGDSIILNCAHGFTFLDNAKVIELKQGPYRGRENEKREIKENKDSNLDLRNQETNENNEGDYT